MMIIYFAVKNANDRIENLIFTLFHQQNNLSSTNYASEINLITLFYPENRRSQIRLVRGGVFPATKVVLFV